MKRYLHGQNFSEIRLRYAKLSKSQVNCKQYHTLPFFFVVLPVASARHKILAEPVFVVLGTGLSCASESVMASSASVVTGPVFAGFSGVQQCHPMDT